MISLTEVVAAVVVHSSAAAYSHLGVPLESRQIERPAEAERVIQRSDARKRPAKVPDCPATGVVTIKA